MIKSRWLSICFLAAAVACLGASLRGRDWLYKEWAIKLLLAATIALIVAMICSRMRGDHRWQRGAAISILLLATLFQSYLLFTERPGSASNVKWSPKGPHVTDLGPDIPRLGEGGVLFQSQKRQALMQEQQELRKRIEQLEEESRHAVFPWMKGELEKEIYTARYRIGEIESMFTATAFQRMLLIVLALGAVAIIGSAFTRWRNVYVAVFLLAWFWLGIWIIKVTPSPFIDVFVFQQESADALLHGRNPYSMTFTNIYGQGSPVYAKELQVDGRVNFGFPYAPLSLLMILPGYLAGDHRFAQLVALVIAAGLIAFSRPGILATLAAILLLTTSRVFMVLELGWTEPLVILWLAATVFCHCRYPRATPYMLGLLLASKQYTLFIPPIAALLVAPRFTWRGYGQLLLKAFIVAAIVTLPLILWDWHAFMRSAVMLQLKQPLREDALSFLLWLYWHVDKDMARSMTWLPYAGVALMTPLCIWLWPKNAGGFAGAVAMVYFTFFALNRQAFANYFFLVIASMCCAVAALDSSAPPRLGGEESPTSPEKPKVPELVAMALQ
jgi:hypothetical protein